MTTDFGKSLNFKSFCKTIQPCSSLINTSNEHVIKDYFLRCFDELHSRMQVKMNHHIFQSRISNVVFSGYLDLPLIVSDRILETFEANRWNEGFYEAAYDHGQEVKFLTRDAFVDGMFDLFFGSLETLKRITFSIMNTSYNMNNKNNKKNNCSNHNFNNISKEDVKLLITYLNNARGNMFFNTEELVTSCFAKEKESMTYEEYDAKIQNENSTLFALILMLIYHQLPFSYEVIKFYLSCNTVGRGSFNFNFNMSKNAYEEFSCTEGKNENENENEFIAIAIATPSSEVEDCLKYFSGHFSQPKRKNASKNILEYKRKSFSDSEEPKKPDSSNNSSANKSTFNFNDDSFCSLGTKSSSGTTLPVINCDYGGSKENNSSDERNNSENKDDNSKSSNFNNTQNTDYSTTTQYIEANSYKFIETSSGGKILKNKIILIGNNLFLLQNSNPSNPSNPSNASSNPIIRIYPLAGSFATPCDEISLNNETFFPFALLSKYGNSLVNVNNIFLLKSKELLHKFMSAFKAHMKQRNLSDYFEVINILGSGVFGTVHYGESKLTGEPVAIKVISKSSLTCENIELVKNEIDIMNFLITSPHANIVRPLDIFEDQNFIYYVLEYMEGGSLKTHLKSSKKFILNETELKEMIKQMTAALSYLDKIGVIHRDIKLENILVKASNAESESESDACNNINNNNNNNNSSYTTIVKISDFGLSTIKFASQKVFKCCGTVLYSAPEVLSKFPYDSRADIWSLGVVAYRLLTGVFPFRGMHSKDVIAKICSEDLTLPDEISEECKYFIENCLRKRPSERLDIHKVGKADFVSAL